MFVPFGHRHRRSLGIACVIAGLCSVLQSLSEATGLAASVNLQACKVPGVSDAARCGTYEVYENRATRVGRKIPLNIVVIPARSAMASEPIFWLEGGPGGAATRAAGPVSNNYLRGLGDKHDLVFVDQRGTGGSNPLKCDDIGETPANIDRYFGPLFPPDLIRACRRKLEGFADLSLYTTSITVADLDEVRAALGYQRINLAGASYGTLTALEYIRQQSEQVRAAFLVGVVPPDFRLPLPFAKAAQNALNQLFTACADDPICRTAFPEIRARV